MSLVEDNAEVLASIAAHGIDLSVPRKIEFAHLLYSEQAATNFKAAAENAGYQVHMEIYPPSELDGREDVWDAVASSDMVPSIESITRTEQELDALARTFGGHTDGWAFESS